MPICQAEATDKVMQVQRVEKTIKLLQLCVSQYPNQTFKLAMN